MDAQDRIYQLFNKIEELKDKRTEHETAINEIDTEIDEAKDLIEDLKDAQSLDERLADTSGVHYFNAIRANAKHRM